MADVPEVIEKVGEETEVATSTETPVEEPEQRSSDQPEEAEGSDQPQADEGGEEEVIKSERGRRRIQQLANDRNEAVNTLRDIAKPEESGSDRPKQTEQVPPWLQKEQDPLASLGDEVTPEQYRQHVMQQAEALVDTKLARMRQQEQVKNNLDADLNYLEKEYPELSGDIQDRKLTSAIEKAQRNFEIAFKANPSVRLRDYIEPIMEARTGGAEKGKSEASAILAEQAQRSAVRPGTQKNNRISSEDELATMLASGEITAKEAMDKYPDLLPSD